MKTVSITIDTELEIPDTWEIVEHEDGITVLKYEDTYCDFTFRSMIQSTDMKEGWWSSDDDMDNKLQDYVVSEDVDIKVIE